MYSDIVNDSCLGNLEWVSKTESWIGETDFFSEQTVKILIKPGGENEQDVLDNIRSKMHNIKIKSEEFKHKSSDSLLDIYNNHWNDDEKINKNTFVKELKLSEISFIYNDKTFLYYEAGDMFKGHAIEVRINNDGTFSEAVLTG